MLLAFAVVLMGAVGMMQSSPHDAYAGVQVDGQKEGATDRLLISSNGTDRVSRIVYFNMENHATGGANTPVASGAICGMAGDLHYAEIKISGTMTGSNPTAAFKWQNSKDNQATWSDVGTWTTINATVTPAIQSQTVSDIRGTTAVAYGDCWRVTYTMSAAAALNFSVIGIEK